MVLIDMYHMHHMHVAVCFHQVCLEHATMHLLCCASPPLCAAFLLLKSSHKTHPVLQKTTQYLSLLVDRVQAEGAMRGVMGGGGWGAAPLQWDAGQVAREQAQRLYNQQMQQAQRHPQQRQQPHMHAGSAVPQDLGVLVLHLMNAVCGAYDMP